MPLAIERVLNVLDDAILLVIHYQDAAVDVLLHRGPDFAQVQEEAAVAGHGHRLLARAERRAHAKLESRADSCADRVYVGLW